jgi:CRP-like cAMP-binding protein
MNAPSKEAGQMTFAPRQALDLSAAPGLWRVVHGVFTVQHRVGEDAVEVLAVPGDLIGVERLGVTVTTTSCSAVTAACLAPIEWDTLPQRLALLREAYDQSQRQCLSLKRLRTGAMPERLRHLLVLLGRHASEAADTADLELPTLRQMAELTDSTAESVCRVLSRLKDQDVLHLVGPGQTRMQLDVLRSAEVKTIVPVWPRYRQPPLAAAR